MAFQTDRIQVDGSINIDGSIFQYGVEFTGGGGGTGDVETSIGTLNDLIQTNISDISNIETSLGTLNGLIQTNISDISNIETSLGPLNGLIQTNISDISNLETSVYTVLNQWNINQDISIAAISTAQGNYVLKTGDTVTGKLAIPGELFIGDPSKGMRIAKAQNDYLQFDRGDAEHGLNLYITSQVGNTFLYSNNIYLGDTVGTSIICRGNSLSGSHWDIDPNGGADFTDLSINGIRFDDKADKNALIVSKSSTYTIEPSVNNCIIECTGTWTLGLPNAANIDYITGFQATIVNVGTGIITLQYLSGAALYTKDSSTKLTHRYSGATIYHRGGGSWIAMGDLN